MLSIFRCLVLYINFILWGKTERSHLREENFICAHAFRGTWVHQDGEGMMMVTRTSPSGTAAEVTCTKVSQGFREQRLGWEVFWAPLPKGFISLLDRVDPRETHDLLEHPQTVLNLKCSTVPKMGYRDDDPVLSLLSVASPRF